MQSASFSYLGDSYLLHNGQWRFHPNNRGKKMTGPIYVMFPLDVCLQRFQLNMPLSYIAESEIFPVVPRDQEELTTLHIS